MRGGKIPGAGAGGEPPRAKVLFARTRRRWGARATIARFREAASRRLGARSIAAAMPGKRRSRKPIQRSKRMKATALRSERARALLRRQSMHHAPIAATRSARSLHARGDWTRLDDEQLLDLRFCDLPLSLESARLRSRIDQLLQELQRRELTFRPHFWIAEEWFNPDGVPGIAVPFYLAHPRLMLLERRQMLEVEGGTRAWCMKILRHEAGHAIDAAYRLDERRDWRAVFGNANRKYPQYYQPRPYSKRFVMHLDWWYAQSHPSEDFAETFAVWLKPGSAWRQRYAGWPALRKIEYVDALMRDVGTRTPPVRSKAEVEPLHRNRRTLREHYDEKRRRYGTDFPELYDRDLRRLFPEVAAGVAAEPAWRFLRRHRRDLRRLISRWTSQYQYTIDQVLREVIHRSRELSLAAPSDAPELKLHAAVLLAVQTMNYLHSGRHRLAL
jgi:hypothetical protein